MRILHAALNIYILLVTGFLIWQVGRWIWT